MEQQLLQLRERSAASIKSKKLLENIYKGFAYELMQLEMTIDNPDVCVGASKVEDFSQLVQLYVLAMGAFEGAKDKGEYFTKKLQQLMKRKSLQENTGLNLNITNYISDAATKTNKPKTVIKQISQENKSVARLSNIVKSGSQTVDCCKGVIELDIRTQQERIRQRVEARSRGKMPELCENKPEH